jgi:hypothetical protein
MQTEYEKLARRVGALASLTMLITVACLGIARAQESRTLPITPLGRHTVGSKLSELRAYRTEDSWISDDGRDADYAFITPDDVEYVVLGESVVCVRAREEALRMGLKLPFGLRYHDGLDAAMAKLRAEGRGWGVFESPKCRCSPSETYVLSEDQYQGQNGWTFKVEVFFEHGQLVRVAYNTWESD